jgi:hypothetical protein
MTPEPETKEQRKERRIAESRAITALPTAGERKAARRKRIEVMRGAMFLTLRVKVKDGDVTAYPLGSRRLGSLEGASAEVTDGSRSHRVAGAAAGLVLVGPVGLLAGLATKNKATAFVIFADGTYRETKLDGNAAVRKAQAEAVRFNLLVGTAAGGEPDDGAPPG